MSTIKKLWQKYKQFILFCLVGVSNTLVALIISSIFLFILKKAGLSLVIAGASVAAGLSSVIGDIAGAINSYILNSKFVFDGRNKQTGARFVASFILYTVLSAALVMLVNHLGVPEGLCKLVVTPVMIIENFLVNKLWVFKNDKR